MSDWYRTELEEGEEILFGVATSSSRSSSASHENGRLAESSVRESERRSGVTNRRVICETKGDHNATVIIPNGAVRAAWVERSDFMGSPKLNLAAVESASGQKAELGIGFLDAEEEAHIRAAFPNAQIHFSGVGAAGATQQDNKPRKKGLLSFLGL